MLLASAFLGLRYLYTRVARQTRHASDNSNLFQVPFLVAFSIAMLFGLHGMSALKVLSILALNYAIAKVSAGHKATPVLTWVFNGLVLFAIDRNSGFSYSSLHPYLSGLVRLSFGFYCVADLTSHSGRMPGRECIHGGGLVSTSQC